MPKYILLLGGLMNLAAVAPTIAAERAVIMGVGALSCGQFAEDYRKHTATEQTYFTWAQGYMSGLNAGIESASKGSANLHSRTLADQKIAIREYCDIHPLAQYALAVTATWATMPGNPPPN